MAPLPPVTNVLKVELKGNSGEVNPLTWANVLHLQYTGTPPTPSVCNDIATDIAGFWNTDMAPMCPSDIHLTEVDVTDLTSSISGAGAWIGNQAGSRAGTALTAQVAALVNYPISTRYRGGHPRSYLLVGVAADLTDAAHWSSTFTAALLTAWKSFLTSISSISSSGTNTTNVCAVSYYSKVLNPVPPYRRTVPVIYTIGMSTVTVAAELATQRRRVGRHRA